ncbi:MAG: hypothetical protein OWT27_00865 [Firmicutes bacterium]|nr:hypothetical protein [Bacillota bacterium]
MHSVANTLKVGAACAVVFASAAIGALQLPADGAAHAGPSVVGASAALPTSMIVSKVGLFAARPKERLDVWRIRNAAIARDLYEDILQLRPFPKGIMNCPADFGPNYDIVFKDGRTVLATAVADASGCNAVRMGGHTYWAAGPGARLFWDELAKALHRSLAQLR